MCGRFTLSSKGDEVALLFGLREVPQLPLRYSSAPTQRTAVWSVERRGDARGRDLLRWGLSPYWAKEARVGNRMINARGESVSEKPGFRWSFRKNRCLIPSHGFFEWK